MNVSHFTLMKENFSELRHLFCPHNPHLNTYCLSLWICKCWSWLPLFPCCSLMTTKTTLYTLKILKRNSKQSIGTEFPIGKAYSRTKGGWRMYSWPINSPAVVLSLIGGERVNVEDWSKTLVCISAKFEEELLIVANLQLCQISTNFTYSAVISQWFNYNSLLFVKGVYSSRIWINQKDLYTNHSVGL